MTWLFIIKTKYLGWESGVMSEASFLGLCQFGVRVCALWAGRDFRDHLVQSLYLTGGEMKAQRWRGVVPGYQVRGLGAEWTSSSHPVRELCALL